MDNNLAFRIRKTIHRCRRGAVLVIVLVVVALMFVLFLRERDLSIEIWDGERVGVDAGAESGSVGQ